MSLFADQSVGLLVRPLVQEVCGKMVTKTFLRSDSSDISDIIDSSDSSDIIDSSDSSDIIDSSDSSGSIDSSDSSEVFIAVIEVTILTVVITQTLYQYD